jgi:hypothetical protein
MSDDPFDVPEKKPAYSWAGAKIGTVMTGTVTDAPVEVQSRNFDTGKPETWDDGNPKMAVVVGVEVDGEKLNLWARKPSALFAALAKAHKADKDAGGQGIAVGGELKVQLSGQKKNPEKPKLNPQNLFRAKFKPQDAFAENGAGDATAEAEVQDSSADEVEEISTPF